MAPKPYCLMPWIHFHVGDKGKVKACCVANIPYGNINTQSFEEIWNGEPILKLREKFKAGQVDPRCAVCVNREKAGAKSIRQETFERYPEIDVYEIETPVYFDIRFSNVCNFRCRTCWHGASSKWFGDAKVLRRNLGEKAIIKNVSDFDEFIRKSGDALKNAQEIYFAGGEPLVTEEHYLLLEWLLTHKVFPKLRYNTNFSVLRFKEWNILKLWKAFPEVEIMASVDGSEGRGEYIRKEFNWAQFLSNRKAIKALNHIHFKVAPTVSILNIAHLPVFYQDCLELEIIKPGDWYFNILERPFYYNVKALPKEDKKVITESYIPFLKKSVEKGIPDEILEGFKSCLDFMQSDDLSQYYEAFKKETKLLDELRKEEGITILSEC